MKSPTDPSFSNNPLQKEHFYITRKALEGLPLSEEWISEPSSGKRSAFTKAEQQTNSINILLKQRYGKETRPLLPAQFHGMKLLHAAAHLIMNRVVAQRSPEFLQQIEKTAGKELSEAAYFAYMEKFITLFPPSRVFQGKQTAEEYLASASNRQLVLEESLFVWLQNQNPALDQFGFLLTDEELRNEPSYQTVVQTFLHSLQDCPASV